MFALVLALLLIILVSVAIVVVVALPNLRDGGRILTPAGERTVQQAREQSLSAVATTSRWMGERTSAAGTGLRRRVPRAAHGSADRAEDPRRAAPGVGAQRPSPVDSGPINRPRNHSGQHVAAGVPAGEPALDGVDGPGRHAR